MLFINSVMCTLFSSLSVNFMFNDVFYSMLLVTHDVMFIIIKWNSVKRSATRNIH